MQISKVHKFTRNNKFNFELYQIQYELFGIKIEKSRDKPKIVCNMK